MFARDLAHAARSWRRQPLFFLTSVAVLAIGLGANLTIFGIINGLLLRPITPDHAERLVGLYTHDTTQPDTYRPFSYPNYLDIAGDRAVFDSVLAHSPGMVGLAEADITRRVFADFVSANFFATLGSPLARGRAFTSAEEAPGADPAVVVISDALFNRLGRPGDVLSRTLRINGRDYAIVGVTPAGFTGTSAIASPELWLPLGCFQRSVNEFMSTTRRPLTDRANHALFLIGRLRPGVTLPAANRLLEALSARMAADQPGVNAHQQLLATPAPRMSISDHPPREGGLRIAAFLLLAVATVVLVIACLNVATLLLSRGVGRRREIAIRLALGANRWRILRQLLAEGLAMAAVACAIGIVAAQRLTALLVATLQAFAPLPIVFDGGVDRRTLAAAVTWTALSTLFFGLGPAWQLTRVDVLDDLQRRPLFATATGWRRRLSGMNLLVVAQIALSLVLLTTAGLFLRGAALALRGPLGYALDGEIVAMLDPSYAGYDIGRAHQLNLSALDRVRTVPSITSASIASTVPDGDIREAASIGASPTARRDERVLAGFTIVGRDYFKTLGIRMVAGRDFSDGEERGAPAARVAVIDELAVKRLFPGTDPIGRTLYMVKPREEIEPLTIVGVVAPIKTDVMSDPEPALYVPFGQNPRSSVALHARVAAGQEGPALAALRTAIAGVGQAVPVMRVTTLRSFHESSDGMWLLTTSGRLFATLGLLAALLAVIGLYAVIAYLVSRRVKEIGIRMALGAKRRDVLVMVVRDGLALTAVGLTIGLALSGVAAQVVHAAASSVAAIDATVFVIPPVLMAMAALVASWVPARRAAGLPPVVALREE